jgi:predicted PurR-regulated permease PerM
MENRTEFVALPDWSAVPSNSSEDCQLLNWRIAYFGAVLFLLSLAFYVFNFIVGGLLRGGWLAYLVNPAHALHVAGRQR